MEFKSRTFKVSKWNFLRITSFKLRVWPLIIAVIICASFSLLSSKAIPDNLLKFVFVTALFSMMMGQIWSAFEKEKILGDFTGELRISENNISINQNQYENFKIIELDRTNFKGEQSHSSNYVPRYSMGVSNYITIEANENSVYKIQFELNSEEQKNSFDQIIGLLIQQNKINFEKAYNGLHLNYEEIQKLKIDLQQRQ
jgi:hypothetical protein